MRAEQLQRLYGRRAGRVTLAAPPGGPAAFAPQTDSEISAIAADGWRVSYDTPPMEFDPVSDPKYLSIQRAGFTGVATPISSGGEHIVLMKRERQVYPNHASLTANSATLSRHVYAGDKLYSSAGVLEGLTNSSTLAAPKPVWACLNPPLECVRTTLHTIRIVAAHAHGRNGKPVAGVRLRMSDGVTTVDYDKTALSDYTLPNGVHVACYEFEVDFSDFATGGYVTADPWIYPHVGAVYKASVDGYAYPAAHATVVKFWNDYAAAEPRVHVFVGPAGDDGTGVASTVEATARAAPYATWAGMLADALAATTGGAAFEEVIVTVLAGTMDIDGNPTNPSNYCMTVRRDPLDTLANCIVTYTTATAGFVPSLTIFDGLTVRLTSNVQAFTSASGGTGYLNGLTIFKDCDFDGGGGVPSFGICYNNGTRWFINVTGDSLNHTRQFGNSDYHSINIIGGDAGDISGNQALYTVVGWSPAAASKNAKIGRHISASTNMTSIDGRFLGWNHVGLGSGSNQIIDVQREAADMGARGAAVVMNIVESFGTHVGHGISSFADTIDEDCENLVIFGNTAPGDSAGGSARCNSFYGRPTNPNPSRKQGAVIGNIFDQYNMKADYFTAVNDGDPTNAPNALQGMENRYWVDGYGMVFLSGDSTGGDTYGPTDWLGEVAPLYSISGTAAGRIDPGFTDDQSRAAGGSGGGDYTPSGGGLDAAAMPAALAHYPFDRAGRAIGDGWVPGALQTTT